MAVIVESTVADELLAQLAAVRESLRPSSAVQQQWRADVRKIVIDAHAQMMLMGVDRHGEPRARLAERTLSDRRRGPGPSLIPRETASRFITRFQAEWVVESEGVWVLSCAFVGIVDKAGRGFAQYHLQGVPERNLPRRDVGGIPPFGVERLRARFALLTRQIGRTRFQRVAGAVRGFFGRLFRRGG